METETIAETPNLTQSDNSEIEDLINTTIPSIERD